MNNVEPPLELLKLKALLDNLPLNHRERPAVEKEYRKKLSGFFGERNTAYHLKFLQHDFYRIHHNIRLSNREGGFYQMDFNISSSNFLALAEVKNLAGEITFNTTFNQLTRRYKGKVERFENPIIQVNNQRYWHSHFLERNHFDNIPIECFVVFSHPNCTLNIDNKNHPIVDYIVLAEELPNKIKKLRLKYDTQIFPNGTLNALSKLLLEKNTPNNLDVLKKFNIAIDELLTGVSCPKCLHLPMTYHRQNWICDSCHHTSETAHYQKLHEYKLLGISAISIREGCRMLLIDNPQALRRLLIKMRLKVRGNNKARVYFLDSGALKNYKPPFNSDYFQLK